MKADRDLIIGRWFSGKFFYLLIALLLLYLAYPILDRFEYVVSIYVLTGFLIITLLSSIYAVSGNRRLVIIALVLALPLFSVSLANVFLSQRWLAIARHAQTMLFFGFVCAAIIAHIFRGTRVTTDTIYGSVCAYLLMGLAWAGAFGTLDVIDDGAFKFGELGIVDGQEVPVAERDDYVYMYYSLVTLSTLGYGDISPITALGQSLAALEAITGQLYLTILVARLVGMHMAQATHKD